MSLVGLSAVALHIICVKCHKLNTNQVLTVLIRKVLDLPRGLLQKDFIFDREVHRAPLQ